MKTVWFDHFVTYQRNTIEYLCQIVNVYKSKDFNSYNAKQVLEIQNKLQSNSKFPAWEEGVKGEFISNLIYFNSTVEAVETYKNSLKFLLDGISGLDSKTRDFYIKTGLSPDLADFAMHLQNMVLKNISDAYKFLTDQTKINQSASLAENKEGMPQISIKTVALMHVYMAMVGGQAVTQQNKNELVKKYGHSSGDNLRNEFTKYQDEDKRLDINTNNKRSAKTAIERLREVIQLLENNNNFQALEIAKKDFQFINKQYNNHYST